MSTLTNLIEHLGTIITRKVDRALFDWMMALSFLLDGGAMSQKSWFIDSVNGSDGQNGLTAQTAIKTDAERQRRMGSFPVWNAGAYHIRYLNDLPLSDPVILTGRRTSQTTIFLHGSTIDGHGKAILYTVAADAVVINFNRATNIPVQVASAGLPVSWTASGLIGQRMRRTNGTAVLTWPVKDLGAKNARCCIALDTAPFTVPFNPATAQTALVNGDTFVVESLVKIPNFSCDIISSDDISVNTPGVNGIVVESLDVGNAALAIEQAQGVLVFVGCILSPPSYASKGISGGADIVSCRITRSVTSPAPSPATFGDAVNGKSIIINGGYSDVDLLFGRARINPKDDFMGQGITITFNATLLILQNVQMFDSPGSPFIFIGAGTYLFVGGSTLWGSGNTTASLDLTVPGIILKTEATFTFSIVSGVADIRICGRTTEWSFDDAVGAFIGAGKRTMSFANFIAATGAGGFGGHLISPTCASGISLNT